MDCREERRTESQLRASSTNAGTFDAAEPTISGEASCSFARDAHGKGGTGADHALDVHLSSVQTGEFAHEREANPRPFVTT